TKQTANKKRINFILVLHNHQPIGNLSEVFEANFANAYQPFIETLSRYPQIKVSLHYSGILLEWLKKNRPDFLERLRHLISSGQVEIMGGGFYEPILPVIPDSDKVGQIRRLNSYLQENLGTTARGMWLTERIWEPHLAVPIIRAGIRYVVVDDSHFKESGHEQLYYYYLTEEEGLPLRIFPISEKLRYLIPFRPPEETINFLHEVADESGERVLVLADDGEKFGSWPDTYTWVYEKGWLERFFNLLQENKDWLQTVTFSEHLQRHLPRGPVYLPATAYREMKEWSGGFWRNFLTRYPESNRMHKKMLAVHRRLEALAPGPYKDRAREHLWAGQCNCAYWHGVFGGLYLNFLRSAVYEHLIKAETLVEKQRRRRPYWIDLEIEDRDYDGQKEIIISTDRFALLFAPHLGGSLWELSYRPLAVNLLDTLTRRKETYHEDLLKETTAAQEQQEREDTPHDGVATIHELKRVKEKDLQKHLVYDLYPRGAFIEHFFNKETNLQSFQRGSYREAADFLLSPATAEIRRICGERAEHKKILLIFRRLGSMGAEKENLLLQKEIGLAAGSELIEARYLLQNRGRSMLEGRFAVEFNLAFLAGYAEDRYYSIPGRELEARHLASVGEEKDVQELSLRDEWRRIEAVFLFSEPALLWRFPLETVSQSEGGLERVYQQSVVVLQWPLLLPPGGERELSLKLFVKTIVE
ncbi:MAG: DUF1926 domain-containing protein, partial [Firmicutes bacterium]|nr:DUF1926 domain-containing protein [Bacillota bacterium]